MIRVAAALAFALAVPTVAAAQADPPEAPVKIKFYKFPDHILEGGIVKPRLALLQGTERPQHISLMRLKHNVLPKLRATRHAGALR